MLVIEYIPRATLIRFSISAFRDQAPPHDEVPVAENEKLLANLEASGIARRESVFLERGLGFERWDAAPRVHLVEAFSFVSVSDLVEKACDGFTAHSDSIGQGPGAGFFGRFSRTPMTYLWTVGSFAELSAYYPEIPAPERMVLG